MSLEINLTPQRILGIDPGSRVCGFACIQTRSGRTLSPRDFTVVDMGVIRLDAKLPHAQRITLLHAHIKDLIKEFDPRVCAVEKAFYGDNASTALKLGETRGALITAILSSLRTLGEITPAQVKKTIVGNGKAQKDQVARSLGLLFNLQFQKMPHDATDALAIALSYAITQGGHGLGSSSRA